MTDILMYTAGTTNPSDKSPNASSSVLPDVNGDTRPNDPDVPCVKIDPTKDLWANIAANVKEATHDSTDQTVLVCGCKQCGKTSIIQRMLGATSGGTPKPTTALEYCYGKKEDRNAVQIAHFWELGQGMDLGQLSDVVLTPESIHATLVVIVVDLADPSSVWDNAIFWLKKVDSRSQELFQKMRAKGSSTPDKLLEKAKLIIDVGHPDLSRIRSSGIPTVLIGSRLDKFKLETGKVKCMAKTMRYLAHLYGASLILTSDHEREATKLRSLLNHLIFQTPFDKKFIQFDSEKGGVLVPVGADTFASIGDPTPCNMTDFKPTGDGELDRWKAPFDEAFPISTSSVNRKNIDGSDAEFILQLYGNNAYAEPLIDSMRKQKDMELEQYRKNALTAKKEKKGGDV